MVLYPGNNVIIFLLLYLSFLLLSLIYLFTASSFFKDKYYQPYHLAHFASAILFHLCKVFLGPEELLATKIFWGLTPLLIGFSYPLLPWVFAYLLLIEWLLEGIPNEWFWGVKFWLNCCLWLWINAFFELFRVAFTWRMFLWGMYNGVKGITTFWPA